MDHNINKKLDYIKIQDGNDKYKEIDNNKKYTFICIYKNNCIVLNF